jgi:hypothetical protein
VDDIVQTERAPIRVHQDRSLQIQYCNGLPPVVNRLPEGPACPVERGGNVPTCLGEQVVVAARHLRRTAR